MKRIYLARHGQTILNAAGKVQGAIYDSPLTNEGIATTKKAKWWLDKNQITFDKVYSSPLGRAIETANILCNKKPIIMDSLKEYDFGPLDGIDLPKPNPYELTQYENGGGEKREDVVKRMYETMMEIGKEDGNNALVVSHGVCCGLLELMMKDDLTNNVLPLAPNSTIYVYQYKRQKLELLEVISNFE